MLFRIWFVAPSSKNSLNNDNPAIRRRNRGLRCLPTKHKPHAGRRKGRRMPFLSLVTLIFDLWPWPSNSPQRGTKHSSVRIWRKSVRQFPRYLIHKQKNNWLTAPETEPQLATIQQRYRQDKQTDRQRQPKQRSDSIGRTVLQTVAQKTTYWRRQKQNLPQLTARLNKRKLRMRVVVGRRAEDGGWQRTVNMFYVWE